MSSVKERVARLSAEASSSKMSSLRESSIAAPGQEDDDVMSQQIRELLQTWKKPELDATLPCEGLLKKSTTSSKYSSSTQVVERPVWQSFVLTLQLHFPEIGLEIEPALQIGLVPPQRVVLSEEAISFLNQMIDTWYQREVEVSTIDCEDSAIRDFSPTQEVLYKNSFRPVTGLQVIVTPTLQRSLVKREQRILRNKSDWGSLDLFSCLSSAYQLLIREQVRPSKRERPYSRHRKNEKASHNKVPKGLFRGWFPNTQGKGK